MLIKMPAVCLQLKKFVSVTVNSMLLSKVGIEPQIMYNNALRALFPTCPPYTIL